MYFTIYGISFNLYYSYGLLGAFDHIYMLICALEILNIIFIIFIIIIIIVIIIIIIYYIILLVE